MNTSDLDRAQAKYFAGKAVSDVDALTTAARLAERLGTWAPGAAPTQDEHDILSEAQRITATARRHRPAPDDECGVIVSGRADPVTGATIEAAPCVECGDYISTRNGHTRCPVCLITTAGNHHPSALRAAARALRLQQADRAHEARTRSG